jgi:hypothetical protein
MKKYSKTTLGFYDTDIHTAEQIPADAVDVSDEDYHLLFERQSEGFDIQPSESGYPVAVERVVSFAALQNAKLAEINREAQKSVNVYLSRYPEFERLSWATQQQEAAVWFAATPVDRIASIVPWCAAAANARGVALADFVALVKGNVDAFTLASAQVSGKRQALADQIYALEDTPAGRDALAAITWEETEL